MRPSHRQQSGSGCATLGPMPDLGPRFRDALWFAADRHNDQLRKGSNIPYVAHLLGTCAIALEAGADEDEAIAALLHDTLEDGKATYNELSARYGERVANIVRECSDSEQDPSANTENGPGRRERKEKYIADLPTHSASGILVSNADKIHNATAILRDYLEIGEALWGRFSDESDPLWYYPELVKTYRKVGSPLAEQLTRIVDQLVEAVETDRQGH